MSGEFQKGLIAANLITLALTSCGKSAYALGSNDVPPPFVPTKTELPPATLPPSTAEYTANIDKPEPVLATAVPEAPIKIDLPYFSQLEPKYDQVHCLDGTAWKKTGCGDFTAAMLDKTSPEQYYRDFLAYFARFKEDGAERFSKNGSDYLDLIAVLSDRGHTFVELSKGDNTKFADVEELIKKRTDQGIPVFIRGAIWLGDGTLGHMSIIVKVNIKEDGKYELVSYDSVFGKDYVIDQSKYLEEIPSRERDIDSTNSLKVYAVYP